MTFLSKDSFRNGGLTRSSGKPLFFSVFFVKIGFVAVGAEKDVRHPVRRSAHLLANHTQVNVRTTFDDQLIMNMTDDEAVPESFHSVAKAVAADGRTIFSTNFGP